MTRTASSILAIARRFEHDAERSPDRAAGLLARAAELRAEAAEISPPPAPRAKTPAPIAAVPTSVRQPPTPRFDHLSRAAKLRLLARGAPLPLPAGMLECAIADGQAVDAFALAIADAMEVERVVRAITEA